MGDTTKSPTVSTKLQWVAEQSARYPEKVITSLAHLMDVDLLFAAYCKTRKDGAVGVDGVTAREYAGNLGENLVKLHARLRSSKYRAPAVKRAWLEKDDGSQRPLGIPAFEDKIVQRAVTMLLGAVYEQEFYDFSYGFRPGRSPHQALKELREKCHRYNINWIVDADVSGFFDNLDHGLLREIIKRRVNDGGLLRLIGKWLNAGVLDGEELYHPVQGTPQGGVVSPILANIFLHHVLDAWFVKEIRPRLKGRCFVIRFADDFVIGCELGEDARRLMAVLPKRFSRFKLTIHAKKSRLVEFRTPDVRTGMRSESSTFDFLGFTHYWAKSRRGNWVIKRKTAMKRLRRAMKLLWRWCQYNRHMAITMQYHTLCSKLRGHYQYYGIRCNMRMLERVYHLVRRAWRRWLGRRHRSGSISLERFKTTIEKTFPLPYPKIVHSF